MKTAIAKKAHTVYKTEAGKRVPSVTTITGNWWSYGKRTNMLAWANNLGLEGIDHTATRDNAAEMGTLGHLLVVADLMGFEVTTDDFTANQIAAAKNAFDSWEAWKEAKEIHPILVETPLVSEVYLFGGQMDIYAEVDGVKSLIDLKTSSAIHEEHKTQVGGGYTLLLDEHGYEYGKVIILRLPRDPGDSYEEYVIQDVPACQAHFLNLRSAYASEKGVR